MYFLILLSVLLFLTDRDQLAELEPNTKGVVQNVSIECARRQTEFGISPNSSPRQSLLAIEILPRGNGLELDNRELLAVQHRGTSIW